VAKVREWRTRTRTEKEIVSQRHMKITDLFVELAFTD
jgi:hypothetical protein